MARTPSPKARRAFAPARRLRRARLAFPGAILLIFGLMACGDGEVPSKGPADPDLKPDGFAAPLTQQELDNLTPAKQYQVASKLLATLWRGVPVESFFDLSQGLDPAQVRREGFLERVREDLSEPLSEGVRTATDAEIFGLDAEGNRDPEQAKYRFDGAVLPKQEPLARIVEYPLSRDMFTVWMAHFLANTIMFSPALKMESTSINDARRVMASLERQIAEGRSVQEIVRGHLPSLSRWRVSRSPENHALEAYELYLGMFDTAKDARRGGVACQNFHLTDEDMGYELVQTPFANTEPKVILDDYYITSCADLYDVVVSHPRFMPRVVEVIVNYLMAGRSTEDRLAMVESIVRAGPETFDDIFKAILFSREYLLHTERVQSIEENMFGTLARLKWSAYTRRGSLDEHLFRRMTQWSNSQLYLDDLGWATMEYKIGRPPDVPMDALSFANYHKVMREHVLRTQRGYDGRDADYPDDHGLFYRRGTEVMFAPLVSFDIREFIDYVFLTGVRRRASELEKEELLALAKDRSWIREAANGDLVWVDDNRADNFAVAMLDYLSRLPELYYFRAVQ